MTDVVKAGERQAAAQTLPEVEFALILSRTINALNEDPSLLRNTVYEMARSTLTKDLSDSDPDRGQRLAQALETAIRGVEDFSVRQNGGIIRGRPIAGPMGRLLDTGRLAPHTFRTPKSIRRTLVPHFRSFRSITLLLKPPERVGSPRGQFRRNATARA